MRRWILVPLLGALALMGCDDKESGGAGCSDDSQCARGQICEDGACAVFACNSLGNCPGSGRTCLFDLRQCSAKECADRVDGVDLTCPPERAICIDSGSYRKSCVAGASCESPADCVGLGDGWSCCGGACAQSCPDMGLPFEDMSVPMPDQGVRDMGAPNPDMGASTGGLCSPCRADGDCAPLGEGARCTPLGGEGSFCASACQQPADCPAGYDCVDGLNRCLPVDLRCVECLRTPCPAGQACDTMTGACVEPQGVCGSCVADDGCRQGLSCQPLSGRQYCFEPCQNGTCADNTFTCENDVCKPTGGRCDACGGQCGGNTPYCIEAERRCGGCGPGSPCPEGLSCDLANYACVERDGCLGDIDCQNSPGTTVCFNGRCVACLQDSDCPPRNACNAMQQCISDPCRGVLCQRGSQCDEGTGRCSPGCNNDGACVDNSGTGRAMACNNETGQCYFTSGACDLGEGDGVCGPGSTCGPNFFDPTSGVCDCAYVDPMAQPPVIRVPCQGMALCIQFIPDQPGFCLGM